ncbi:DUF5348 domain-containing protein [Paenibacillus cymbidii]|uniref:DUF5348 domain-containing protein n=1 Tax=Paenibacillus cymbidii TaxID=1639034 RepID=UPI0022A899DF|nr:DUF5348 domain-containing protein [Paenibacillus cymbidii]
MAYNREDDRWEVQRLSGVYALHCGDRVELNLGEGLSRVGRLEMDRVWYVTFGSISYYLREKQTYRIAI